jgi:hypothetical protein
MAMSKEHKEALKQGRAESRAIKAYLGALERRRPGRPVTESGLKTRLEKVSEKLSSEKDSLKRLELIQTRLDLEGQLKTLADSANLEGLEAAFKKHAPSYSERKGITYTAWREAGVPAAVLKSAGIPETRRR